MIRKALTSLSLLFLHASVTPAPVVAAPMPLQTTVNYTDAYKKQEETKQKLIKLLKEPDTPLQKITEVMSDVNYKVADFDKRDLYFLGKARKELFGDITRDLMDNEVTTLMQRTHQMSLQDALEKTRRVLRNPKSKINDIRSAMNGYDLRIHDNAEYALTPASISYLAEARAALHLSHKKHKLSDRDIARLADFMSDKQIVHDRKVAGIIVGGGIALWGGNILFRRVRKRFLGTKDPSQTP